MSKFDYEQMGNDDLSVMCYNKDKYTKEQALLLAKIELELIDENIGLEIFSSFIQYGFYNFDGEVSNSWFIKSLRDSLRRTSKNQVAVWVVSEPTYY